MPDQTLATSDYTMGYSEVFLNLLGRRSMESHAKHLLRHLKSGLRAGSYSWLPLKFPEHRRMVTRCDAAGKRSAEGSHFRIVLA